MGIFDDEENAAVPGQPPKPAVKPDEMSNEDMIAMALTALAPALLGGAMGGKQGALAGGAAGAKGAGMIAQHQVDKLSEADKIAETAKAQELARAQRLEDEKELIVARNDVKPPAKPETRSVGGQLVQKNDKGKWEPVYTSAETLQQTQFVGDDGKPLTFNKKTGTYQSGEVAQGGVADKRLSPSDTKQSQGGAESIQILDNLETSMKANKGLFGPVSGRVGGNNPYDTDAQAMQSELKTSAQLIGKYMEGGVLRREDEIKYEKMLPNLKDTPEVAEKKARLVRKMLEDKQAGEAKALKGSGYSTKGIEGPAAFKGRETTKDGVKYREIAPDQWEEVD